MRRWLRVGLIGFGGLAVLAGLAVTVFFITFDPNAQKDRIIEAVRRATGRELVLAGPLRLTLGWTPTIEAEDAALSNRPGGSRPQMATIARLQASVALLPLLSRRVEIESVTLDRPDILLETDAQGIGNWQFDRPAADAQPTGPAIAAAPHDRSVVAVRRLVVVNGRVTWRNEATGRVTTVDVPHATVRLDHNEDALVADAQTSGQTLHLDAIMVTDGAGPLPIKLALDAGGAHVALDGALTLPLSAHSYQGRVDATAPDLAVLGSILKLADLPPLHDVRLHLVLAGAESAPGDISLHAGASDLGAYLPGATLGQLDLTMPALGQVGRVTGEGGLPGGPWRLASGISVTRQTIALRAMNLTTPGGDFGGDIALTQGERPALRGTVIARLLDVDWLRHLQRPETVPPATGPAAPQGASPPAAARRVFSDTPLPWAKLRTADADLAFTIGTLRAGGADYRNVAGHISLLDGALRLDPLVVQAPEGRVDAVLLADASLPDPSVALTLRSAAFRLDPVLQAAGLPGGADAPVEVDAALTSTGQSPHALASHLSGHLGLAVVDGTIANSALVAALGDLAPRAGRLDPAGRSTVRCLAVRLDAQAGQVTLNALNLDTSRLDVSGTGVLNLADETMDLRLRPTVLLGGTGILAPVKVAGGFEHPAASLDAQGVDGRSGIVIGGAAPPDGCPAALALARDGRAGRMPGPVLIKAPKAADLLRSFLR